MILCIVLYAALGPGVRLVRCTDTVSEASEVSEVMRYEYASGETTKVYPKRSTLF